MKQSTKIQPIYEVVRIKQERKRLPKLENFQIRSPQDAIQLATELIGEEDRENFLVICLNTKNKINAVHIAHKGSVNASIVEPREVFKSAILNNATSIIGVHNHPSSDLTPSPQDIDVTKRLSQCGSILGIELLDHIIVNDYTGLSLKEKGYL